MMPLDVRQQDERTLAVSWPDGHESFYPCEYLRKNCRCAECVDEWTGQRRLDPAQVSPDVHPIQIQGVGRYGLRIHWSDGHNAGIYTFQRLREICPCGECRSKLSESKSGNELEEE